MPGINPKTGKPGPTPAPAREGDKKQARHRINMQVRSGYRLHPNKLPCTDCGHIWKKGERRHEYDHYKGYAAKNHENVEPVCTTCHVDRDSKKKNQETCVNGHSYNEENTARHSSGRRFCRTCRRDRENKKKTAEWWRARRARKKVNLPAQERA